MRLPAHQDSRLVEMIAGVCGGISVVLVGHPFDTTKTRLQVAPKGYYKGSLDCVRQTLRAEGLSGFYSGMSSPLMGQMVFRAASFTTFHATLQRLRGLSDSSTSVGNLMAAGSITGIVIAFIETPIDVIKTKLQVQIFSSKLSSSSSAAAAAPVPFNSFRTCVAHTVNTHGPRALFQGLSATLVRNVPANALFFPVNEMSKQQLVARRHRQGAAAATAADLSLAERLAAGASAGLCYWVLTYPLDAIKGRMQGTPFEQRPTWLGTARGILREHGPRGFLRGLGPCAMRSVPACSALFATMDIVKLKLGAGP